MLLHSIRSPLTRGTWWCAGAGEPSRARDHHGGVPDHERWHARENRGSYIQAAHRPGRAKRPGDQHLSARTARLCHTHPGLEPRRAVCWQLPLSPTQVTPFHSSKPPTISVKSYLEDRCGGASTAQHRCAPPPLACASPLLRAARVAVRLRAGLAHAAHAPGAVLAHGL
eukprot:scaffold12471_cov55-Phaeocystis_antarctica.AAC.1